MTPADAPDDAYDRHGDTSCANADVARGVDDWWWRSSAPRQVMVSPVALCWIIGLFSKEVRDRRDALSVDIRTTSTVEIRPLGAIQRRLIVALPRLSSSHQAQVVGEQRSIAFTTFLDSPSRAAVEIATPAMIRSATRRPTLVVAARFSTTYRNVTAAGGLRRDELHRRRAIQRIADTSTPCPCLIRCRWQSRAANDDGETDGS